MTIFSIEARNPIFSLSMPDRHVMVDIETLDTDITAAIVAIAAVTFDPRSSDYHPTEEWSCTIDQKSNLFHGRTISDETIDWWMAQSEEAKAKVFNGPHTELSTALRSFTQWLNKLRPTCTRIWAKDPDFDIKILHHACSSLNIRWPFGFWEARSCRTAMELAYPEGHFPLVKVDGPLHDALTDARKQVVEIQHSYHVLGS